MNGKKRKISDHYAKKTPHIIYSSQQRGVAYSELPQDEYSITIDSREREAISNAIGQVLTSIRDTQGRKVSHTELKTQLRTQHINIKEILKPISNKIITQQNKVLKREYSNAKKKLFAHCAMILGILCAQVFSAKYLTKTQSNHILTGFNCYALIFMLTSFCCLLKLAEREINKIFVKPEVDYNCTDLEKQLTDRLYTAILQESIQRINQEREKTTKGKGKNLELSKQPLSNEHSLFSKRGIAVIVFYTTTIGAVSALAVLLSRQQKLTFTEVLLTNILCTMCILLLILSAFWAISECQHIKAEKKSEQEASDSNILCSMCKGNIEKVTEGAVEQLYIIVSDVHQEQTQYNDMPELKETPNHQIELGRFHLSQSTTSDRPDTTNDGPVEPLIPESSETGR